jgi:hypothetical protein
MSDLKTQIGELRATIHVTRKDTGNVDTYEIVGKTTPEQHEQIMQQLNEENDNGSHT